MLRMVFGLCLLSAVLPPGGWAQGGCTPHVQARPISRNLPHALHDQALESLKILYPQHQLLVARRSAVLGPVEYALVAYRQTLGADTIQIAATAVVLSSAQAWSVDATCTTGQLPEALVSMMEILANLPKRVTH
jgi:hypothetical protein